MSERDTVLRSMHDTGLAAWFGVAQWMIPVFTGALLVVSSLAGEQQKPRSVLRGLAARVRTLATPSTRGTQTREGRA
jgi:hypothetical protein